MKTVLIVILSGVVAIPIVSWALYGYDWGISAWFGILAAAVLTILIVNKAKGTRPF
jgi:F0F1-type ATP synthase assembly protein I